MSTTRDCWLGNIYVYQGCQTLADWPLAERIPVALGAFVAGLAGLLIAHIVFRWAERTRALSASSQGYDRPTWRHILLKLELVMYPEATAVGVIGVSLLCLYMAGILLFGGS